VAAARDECGEPALRVRNGVGPRDTERIKTMRTRRLGERRL
jgi:hypothetical protein